MECEADETFWPMVRMKLFDQWRAGEYCDFTVHAKSRAFNVHRNILASCSDYFRAMFNSNMVEKEHNEVRYEDVDDEVMSDVLKFCYTSKINLSVETVTHILPFAHHTQIDGLIGTCQEFINNEMVPKMILDSSNCFKLLTFASKYEIQSLYQVCLSFIRVFFRFLVSHQTLRQLDIKDLINIISHEHLNVDGEEDIVHVALCWIKEDLNKRLDQLNVLMSFAKLELISSKKLAQLIDKYPFAASTMIKELNSKLAPAKPPESMIMKLRKQDKVLFKFLDYDPAKEYGCTYLEMFRSDTNKVETMQVPMSHAKLDAKLALMGDRVYVIGGTSEGGSDAKNEYFDFISNSWHILPKMGSHRRKDHLVAALDGDLYVVGGEGKGGYNCVEYYSSRTNEWFTCAPQIFSSYSRIAATSDKIYVINNTTLESYDPLRNIWQSSDHPHKSNGRHLCYSLKDSIVFVPETQWNGSYYIEVHFFDQTSNSWFGGHSFKATLYEASELAEIRGYLYIWNCQVGKHLAYEIETKKWTVLNSSSKHMYFEV